MTAYKSRNQIHRELEEILPEQIADCRECEALPPALEELLLHNFQAKFVCYNKEEQEIEVGIEKQESVESYPNIKVLTFPLEEVISRLGETFKSDDRDLKFYAKIIAKSGVVNQVDDVVFV